MVSVTNNCCLYNKLQVYWAFSEASGNRAPSFSAEPNMSLVDNNTVGQANGVTGKSAFFVAANSEYFSLGDLASTSFGNESFTVACWVYLGDQTIDRRVFHKGRGLGANEFSYALRYRQASNNMRFAISDGSSASGINSNETISGNTWYFVVCWHDASLDTINISVNAGTPATASWTSGSINDSDPLVIGSDTQGTYYDGRICKMGIWRRVLVQAEINMLYNGGNGVGSL